MHYLWLGLYTCVLAVKNKFTVEIILQCVIQM